LSGTPGVHAVTDVTGFGLLGHALEVCRGSGLAAIVELEHLPLLPEVERLAQEGFGTGGATRNWSSYGEHVRLPAAIPEWRRGLLCDPQTSGGLLIAVDAAHASSLVAHCRSSGFDATVEIGELASGPPQVRVV
jgi:selenide, water dikinase